jgi:hypothetical protein
MRYHYDTHCCISHRNIKRFDGKPSNGKLQANYTEETTTYTHPDREFRSHGVKIQLLSYRYITSATKNHTQGTRKRIQDIRTMPNYTKISINQFSPYALLGRGISVAFWAVMGAVLLNGLSGGALLIQIRTYEIIPGTEAFVRNCHALNSSLQIVL